ncbi:alpha/beta hydrolase [Thermodesulfobacteriota bacterium]
MYSFRLFAIALLLGFLTITGSVPVGAADNATELDLTCDDYTIPVKLSQDRLRTYSVVGRLCREGELAGKTLQVLISGAGYGPEYWDFSYEPETYSYVRAAARAGFATFNLSRIGIGASDHPRGRLIDVQTNAYVVHQVIEHLRKQISSAKAFGDVVTVGHSLGSLVTLAHAVGFPGDTDGVLLTGFVHNTNPEFGPAIGASSYRAIFDPRFFRQGYDLQYITSRPGTRGDLFYYLPQADPAVIAHDEATKETTTISEITTMSDYFTDLSLAIAVPVLVAIGDDDIVGCGGELDCSDHTAVAELEQQFFAEETCVETTVIEEAGHNLNLHYSAPQTYAVMLDWAARRIGTDASGPGEPCE